MTAATQESSFKVMLEPVDNTPVRVLHVDDDPHFLKIAKQCLETDASIIVETATSVEEAIGKLEDEKYDVIISDYQMPGKNGLEFLKELRDRGKTVPFIVFTGKGREEVAIRALNLGATQYLSKVGDTETVYAELTHSIKEVARVKKAEEELRRFSSAVKTSLDGIIIGDVHGRIIEANDAIMKMYGSNNKDDLVGKSCLDLTTLEEREKAFKQVKEVLNEGHTTSREYNVVTRGGDKLPVELSATIMKDEEGKPIGFVGIVRDITERKKAEKALRESEESSRNLLRSISPDCVLIIDDERTIIDCNDAVELVFGYPRNELIGKKTAILFPDGTAHEEYGKEMHKVIATKGHHVAQLRGKTKNGKEIIGEVSCSSIKGKGGAVVIIRDITNKNKEEEVLRNNEEKFRSLAEQSPNMIFINKRGRIVYANKKAEEILGYNRKELVSADFSFLDLVARESKKTMESAFNKQVQVEDVAPFELKIVTKEGKKLDVILNSKIMNYDGESAVLGMITDITGRKQSERTILESQQKFKGLFIGNPEAATYLSPDFRILDINPRFEELFGYSIAEIKGKHLDDVIVQNDKMEEAGTLNGRAAQGYVYHNTFRRRKDGSLVPVSISAAPITAEGRLIGYVGMYKDITDLKKTERTLGLMNEKLRVVGGLTRHDIRNKLTAITGNTFLMKKKLANNPDTSDNLKDIESAGQQIERILGFAKDYEMLGVEELTYTDVEQVINEAASLFHNIHELKIVNNCGGLAVLADSLLRQLFYNLIDNSLKYGEKVKCITTTYEKVVDEQLKLIYEDDGVGIPVDVKPKIFNEGYTTGKGSGYGLYLIKKMMEVYGWTIQEAGEPRKGAVFTIIIPKVNESGKANYRLS